MARVPDALRPANLPRWLLLAIAFVFVFIVGYCIPYVRATRLDARLETTTRALTLARLENTLAAATLEASHGRYEPARQLASDFFTGLQRTSASAELAPDVREAARAILAQRDTTITLLSRSVGSSREVLDRLLVQYRSVAAAGAR